MFWCYTTPFIFAHFAYFIFQSIELKTINYLQRSIFLVEGKNAQRDLIKLQQIDLEHRNVLDIDTEVGKTLNLCDAREKLSLSTSTSTDSLI